MKVRYTSAEGGSPRTGELQQWLYHPDVGAMAVIMTPSGSFEAVGMRNVVKDGGR